MAGKIVAQLVIAGMQVFSKAFGMAYQQAAQNAKRGGADAVKAAAVRGSRMKFEEAVQVLNLNKTDVEGPEATKKMMEVR